MGLTVLVPVTKPDPGPFAAALAASDVPRHRMMLLIDAPGCDAWTRTFPQAEVTRTFNPPPTQDQLERRERHRAMREITRTLAPDGPLLCLEDDTLVPPDVYARLTAVLARGFDVASGVQVSRWGNTRAWGVWRFSGERFCTLNGRGIEHVDAVGHYCLLTTGEVYAAASCEPSDPPLDAIDRAHTSRMGRVGVDWGCVCGHQVGPHAITRASHLVAYEGVRFVARVGAIHTQAGAFWPDMHGADFDPGAPYDEHGVQTLPPTQEATMTVRGKMYVHIVNGQYEPIVGPNAQGHNVILVGRRQEIPLQTAILYARLGYIADAALHPYMALPDDPPDPRFVEFPPEEPTVAAEPETTPAPVTPEHDPAPEKPVRKPVKRKTKKPAVKK